MSIRHRTGNEYPEGVQFQFAARIRRRKIAAFHANPSGWQKCCLLNELLPGKCSDFQKAFVAEFVPVPVKFRSGCGIVMGIADFDPERFSSLFIASFEETGEGGELLTVGIQNQGAVRIQIERFIAGGDGIPVQPDRKFPDGLFRAAFLLPAAESFSRGKGKKRGGPVSADGKCNHDKDRNRDFHRCFILS